MILVRHKILELDAYRVNIAEIRQFLLSRQMIPDISEEEITHFLKKIDAKDIEHHRHYQRKYEMALSESPLIQVKYRLQCLSGIYDEFMTLAKKKGKDVTPELRIRCLREASTVLNKIEGISQKRPNVESPPEKPFLNEENWDARRNELIESFQILIDKGIIKPGDFHERPAVSGKEL